jgi:RimJ/RimL family protein N-acetyltransferase
VAEDFSAFCAFHSDEACVEFIGGIQSPPVVWRTMRSGVGAWYLDGFHFFSVLERETGTWIGRIGPMYPHQWPGREIGWGLLSSHWGKGFAREAVSAAMDYVFDELGWDDVIHTIHPDNSRSKALAVAIGSRNRGPGALPDPFQSVKVDIWGQTREEWRASKIRADRGK